MKELLIFNKPREVQVVDNLCAEIEALTSSLSRYNKTHKAKPNFKLEEWKAALGELSISMEQLQKQIEILNTLYFAK